jgi:predicted alpha-1,6-mannanase (GH76 family)
MDNCEVNMGLKAALWLKDNGLIDNAVDFSTFLAQNTASVKALYNGTVFRWNKGANGTGTPDLSKFYADAVCQLYPGLFQVIEPDSEIANKVYTQFNRNFGSWASGTTYDDYPWTIIAYAAATINDVTRVETYVKHIYSYNSKGQQKDRWYSAEAGSLLLAIDRIQNPIVDSKYSHIN